ncbi:hypothetical protein K7X08_010083 [Anisodus acutangulus]|uniref:carotenoid 9,10-dioxygenase n=1 Tax=Anisodus acutangulus TaxID=402998 RepID=A0A9Q1N0G2_9SOLA|nr:hypothetical protein K7X08_010083 [Anisodus acutangulus]
MGRDGAAKKLMKRDGYFMPEQSTKRANAWEEGDEVVLITCHVQNPDLDMVNGGVKEKLENFCNELYEMRFNMKSGAASQRKLSESAVDFPRINENYSGRKQRYVYGTTLNSFAKCRKLTPSLISSP